MVKMALSGRPIFKSLGSPPQIASPKPSIKKATPMVAMNRLRPSWPTRGRSTTRSATKASATMIRRENAPARYQGTPSLIMPAKLSAAKNTIAPWAKLKTLDDLKMITKPIATSA